MKKAGLIVPDQFDEMPEALKSLYTKMVQIEETPEAETPAMFMDYTWVKRRGIVRNLANFTSQQAVVMKAMTGKTMKRKLASKIAKD
eukprot:15979348-Heterocapsa_arctica.AAC.1